MTTPTTTWRRRGISAACMTAIVVTLIPGVSMESQANETPRASTAWELKGIRYGMSAADVMETLPSLACDTEAKGVVFCSVEDTFAGQSAEIYVFVLDDSVVQIRARNLNQAQTDNAISVWTEKYRAPDSFTIVTKDVTPTFTKKPSVSAGHATWEDGEVQVEVVPFSRRDTYRNILSGELLTRGWIGYVKIGNATKYNEWESRSKINPVDKNAANDI